MSPDISMVNKTLRRYIKSKKTLKNLKCSPNRKGKKKYTCYSDESLEKLRKLWNARHPDHRIKSTKDKKIWKALKKYMGDVCETEKCWLRQHFIKNNLTSELVNYTFAPESPQSWKKNPTEWLTSLDIEKVMKQYERKYKNFKFIGPSPIDFDKHLLYNECVWEELCKFNLEKYIKQGKTKIGVIFNTDPHYKEGSHWISLFIDISKKYIFFFDSTGDDVPKEINILINRIISQANTLGIKLKRIINKQSHQRGDTECGMYSLFLIIELLENRKTPNNFIKNRISDKEMENLRKIYFNDSNK